MKKNILSLSVLLLLLFASCKPTLTVYMIGDSTMANKPLESNPERGWGQLFQPLLDKHAKVSNHAVNGRSTRTFLSENRWQPIMDSLQKGDYVVIQFGHNDQDPKKVDRYIDSAGYRHNLELFVNDSRSKGATPILATSVMRRRFDEQGDFYDTHGIYPGIVRAVAADLKVPLLDMHQSSKKIIEQHGVEHSKKIFLYIAPGLYDTCPEGRADSTHFSEYGATLMAKAAAAELKALNIGLSKYVK